MVVRFVVETDGSVSNIEIVRGVSEDLDAEAKRIVSTFPKWTPGKQDGQPVAVRYHLPILFKLAPEQKK